MHTQASAIVIHNRGSWLQVHIAIAKYIVYTAVNLP